MPKNIEIKARVPNRKELERRTAELANYGPEIIMQEDTFLDAPEGRLKIRKLNNELAQLIHYLRPNQSGPKPSDYQIAVTHSPEILLRLFGRLFSVSGRVVKRRTLYLIGQTRVHLDSVDSLGEFVELEVVLDEDQSLEEGEMIASELMIKLGINQDCLLKQSYADLIDEDGSRSRASNSGAMRRVP